MYMYMYNCSLTSSNEAGTGPPAIAYINTVQEGNNN